MPELPEAEAWRRALHTWLVPRTIREVQLADPAVVRPRLSTRPGDAWSEGPRWTAGWVGRDVVTTARVGKRIGLQVGDTAVLVHLGMTGRFERTDTPPRHGRIGLRTDEGWVWFADTRRFGCLAPLESLERLGDGLGPDALDACPDGDELAAALPGRRAIKVALLDQARLAGLGNIHAVEALWRAGIDPACPCDRLDGADHQRLARAIRAQLEEAVAGIDATAGDFTYVTEGGDNPFAVYGREGSDCRSCGRPILRRMQGGRSTFWCPGCQPQR
jgi:formamidopyrimidine-DNA glycosylase